MEKTTALRVCGDPAPQGSKKAIRRGSRVALIESSRRVKPWRKQVELAALAARARGAHNGPVLVWVRFLIQRPKSHYGTGRNAGVVKESAPPYPTSRAVGDLDKLLRSTLDGLTDAGVIRDDADVVDVNAAKHWALPDEGPGALIHVYAIG